MDDTENRRVRADAEREREHGHGGEAGVLQQLAKGELQVIHGFSTLDLRFEGNSENTFDTRRKRACWHFGSEVVSYQSRRLCSVLCLGAIHSAAPPSDRRWPPAEREAMQPSAPPPETE